ncbi:MAG: 4'-phosphopantetheinyl transferase superfamily protein [Spirochaetes bacterium]|nr:4'-phosphopantetheinyl transferase superfamily protein [Spirochaetota bacterium]
MVPFYIGLSILSIADNQPSKAALKKFLSAEARRILSLLNGSPLKEDDILKEKSGRPFIPEKEIDFNISHSGTAAAVSLIKNKRYYVQSTRKATAGQNPTPCACDACSAAKLRGTPARPFVSSLARSCPCKHDATLASFGNIRTGCDIQLIQPRANARKIAKEFFCPAEVDYIFSNNEALYDEMRFFQIWTLKECFIKLRGLSVFDMPKVPSFICSKDSRHFAFETSVSSPLSFFLYELSGSDGRYMLAVAAEGVEVLQPEIRWFSQSFLPCRSMVEIKAALSPPETVIPKM